MGPKGNLDRPVLRPTPGERADRPAEPRAGDLSPLVAFSLDGRRYALPLTRVVRSLRVVAITALPGAPPAVLGIIDLGGSLTPIIDLRLKFGHPPREVRLSDHLVVARTARRPVALLVDDTLGVIEADGDTIEATDGLVSGVELVSGAVKGPDGLVLIHDLDRLLSLDEDAAIDRALRPAVEARP